MICLCYQDEDERVDALLSIAQCCRRSGVPLVFLGSQIQCVATEEAVRSRAPSSLSILTFRPPTLTGVETNEASLSEINWTALLEFSAVRAPIVAWIEIPWTQNCQGMEHFLFSYYESLNRITSERSIRAISTFNFQRAAEMPKSCPLERNVILYAACHTSVGPRRSNLS